MQRLPLAAQCARRGKVRQRALRRRRGGGLDRASLERQFAGAHRLERGALYAYLRHGYSAYHGVASGPMAPVVGEGLAKQSDEDLRALAHYLASYAAAPAGETDQQQAQRLDRQGYGRVQPPSGSGARLFAGACLACHHDGDGPRFFGVRPSLALNSNVHADSPDNLLRIILDGIHSPATGDLGYMPGFRHSLDDRQVAALANYLRERFAGKPAWPDLAAKAASLRQQAAP